MKYYLTSLYLLLTCTMALKAQDTIHSEQPDTIFYNYSFENDFNLGSFTAKTDIDTTLQSFHRYEPLKFSIFTGNTGAAGKSLLFTHTSVLGFETGENAFTAYLTQADNVKYYNVSSPFSDLYYVIGSKREQLFKVTHTQNINERWNIAVNFNLINSLGAYNRQKTDHSSFVVSNRFTGKKKRYTLLAHFSADKCYLYENGGLLNMNDFFQQTLDRADLFEINLAQAQNRLKKKQLYVKQYLGLFRFRSKTDTTDTSAFATILSHTFNYSWGSNMYIDEAPSLNFYPAIGFENIYTGDSINYRKLSNTLGLTQVIARSKKGNPVLFAQAGLEHIYAEHRSYLTQFKDSLVPVLQQSAFISQYLMRFKLHFNPSEDIQTHVGGHYIIGNYNNGDAGINTRINLFLNKKHGIVFDGQMALKDAPYQYMYYASNHFSWVNKFNKTLYRDLSLSYSFSGYTGTLSSQIIKDYIYFNTDALPQQFNNNINVLRLSLSKHFTFGAFHSENTVHIQHSSQKDILPLPLIMNDHSLYWGTWLFKNALFTQLGIDILYYSRFNTFAYMPVTRQFYLTENTTGGNYPFIDFFIQFKVKRALIFAKLTHLNQGLNGRGYYNVKNYPLQGRAFKAGVSWKFYD